jgi:hypothetical protein
MNGYYKVTEKLRDLLIADPDINTVTKGPREEIDNYKATMFGIAHIAPLPSRFTTNTIVLVYSINALNIRDISKTPTLDKFLGNDNEDDNLNAMLYVHVRLYLQLKKFGDEFDVINEMNPNPVTYQFKNLLDGWECTYEIEIPIDEVTAC